ncbi:hypothetical protein SCG7086_BI_00100 [Chlamydiales bacterium SCGC AG-110-P3]|nr:hypothetical protein SCG7086_BI_00100 [Chlamydiales bacterium SCGC AG-110-P3]
MYELSVAWKYLIPRRKHLSVSIISFISVVVISLVVWLILVFFSVTEGLEKGWMDKLTALTAPVRISPTEEYYKSYYYRIDSVAEASDYSTRSISEKLSAQMVDPYNPDIDAEVSYDWPAPDLDDSGHLKDIVKEAFASVSTVSEALGLGSNELWASDFEMAVSNIRLRLIRDDDEGSNQRFLSQASYLGSFDPSNPALRKALLSLSLEDMTNILQLATVTSSNLQQNASDPLVRFAGSELRSRLHAFFDHVKVTAIHPKKMIWTLPSHLLPAQARWQAFAVMRGGKIQRVIIPQGRKEIAWLTQQLEQQGCQYRAATLTIDETIPERKTLTFENNAIAPLPDRVPVAAAGRMLMRAELIPDSIDTAETLEEVQFTIQLTVHQMEIARARPTEYFSSTPSTPPFWLHYTADDGKGLLPVLPRDPQVGDGILISKTFRENDVRLGDRGYLSYYMPTTSSVQEQRIPVYVAGFYDPGIIPIGGKLITVSKEVTNLVRSAQQQEESTLSNGINVRFHDLSQASRVKSLLKREFARRGIDKYWKIESFREFDFTRDIVQQLQSEKNLFSLISMIIIVVACSNIISMLIILVNDKQREIGILRSMGATAMSIGSIFGLCGMVMGALGGLIGTVAAAITLRNLPALLELIGRFQGFDVFNRAFYGDMLPTRLSTDALLYVLIATVAISVLAGLIPAFKAAAMRPADILRKD